MRAHDRVFDDGTTKDARDVIAAALALEISEFDLFRLAYRQWYGTDADQKWIERSFVAYLFSQRVPLWVRHYCRVARLAEPPDRVGLGIDGTVRRRARLVMPGGGSTAVIGVAALLMFAIVVGVDRGKPFEPLSCHGGGPGLRYAENLAFALAGRPNTNSCPEPYKR